MNTKISFTQKPTTPSILGVDPGRKGAVALLSPTLSVSLFSLPASEAGIWDFFQQFSPLEEAKPIVFLEQVSGYIGSGHPGSRMFTFGENYGFIQMALYANGLQPRKVLPRQWQKTLGMKKQAQEKRNPWKKRLWEEARSLYPKVKILQYQADALLIATHGYREVYYQQSSHSKRKSSHG